MNFFRCFDCSVWTSLRNENNYNHPHVPDVRFRSFPIASFHTLPRTLGGMPNHHRSLAFLLVLLQKKKKNLFSSHNLVFVDLLFKFWIQFDTFIAARKRSLRRLCFYTCLSFCSRGGGGGGEGGIPACLAGLQAHTQVGGWRVWPGGGVGGLKAHTQGVGWGVWPRGRGSPGPHPGGVSRPTLGGGVSQHALRQTPQSADGYCCGRYASYWNAFLFYYRPQLLLRKGNADVKCDKGFMFRTWEVGYVHGFPVFEYFRVPDLECGGQRLLVLQLLRHPLLPPLRFLQLYKHSNVRGCE